MLRGRMRLAYLYAWQECPKFVTAFTDTDLYDAAQSRSPIGRTRISLAVNLVRKLFTKHAMKAFQGKKNDANDLNRVRIGQYE